MNKNQQKKLKKIYKKYAKKLNSYNKKNNVLDYLITYLSMRRAYFIFLDSSINPDVTLKYKIETLSAAILAYKSYLTCITKYYTSKNNFLSRKFLNQTAEEVNIEYAKEKKFYWEYFWEIVKQNMESWVE